MGCSQSVSNDKIMEHPQFHEWMNKFSALQISKSEALKLHAFFQRADLDGGGSISLLELLTIIDLERTPFTKRVFSIFDDDGSGEIDFGEFVLALWNYCTLSKVSLAMFAFDLYDRDSSGVLEPDDLENMLRDIYGKAAGSSHYAKQVAKELAELEAKGEVKLDQFLEFTRTHHSLLWPAFQMQFALKKKIMGVNFWQTHAERRVKLTKNKYVKIKDLLRLHAKGQLDSIDATLVPQTQTILENIGTKGDRQKAKQKNQDSSFLSLADLKSKKEQEFMKNYVTGDYKMAMATKNTANFNANKSIKATNNNASQDDITDQAGTSSKSHENGSMRSTATASTGNNSSTTPATKKKSVLLQNANDANKVLHTVLEDIQAKEKEEEESKQQQQQQYPTPGKAKHGLKPAVESVSIQQQQQQKKAAVLSQNMQRMGMDAQVLEHIAENTLLDPNRGPIVMTNNAHTTKVKPVNTRASWFGGTSTTTASTSSNLTSTVATHAASAKVLPTFAFLKASSDPVSASTITPLVMNKPTPTPNNNNNNNNNDRARNVTSPSSFSGKHNASVGSIAPTNATSSNISHNSSTNSLAVPIDPVALLLSPNSNINNNNKPTAQSAKYSNNTNAGKGLRAVASANTVVAMLQQQQQQQQKGTEPLLDDTNNETAAIMANHKRRAQRRASVGF